MNISEKTLKNIICETINEYFYGDDEASGDVVISLEELIERMPESDLKSRLLADSDFAEEMLSNMAFEYSLDLKGYRREDPGDYWTPSNWWVENMEIRNDDGLLDNIKSIPDEQLRNGLLQAYQEIEREVKNGDFEDQFDE